MPGKVKVKIISGRNLPVMDRSSDTTDAYVEIKLGTTTFKTDVCRKSLHPQWNSEWYRFELDDAELQDEPLQIRLMDHDTYSANDAIGKVYLDLNPLLLPVTTLLGKWNDGGNSCHEGNSSVMSGWIPVYDTMHGIRGEVNVIVKVELFTDFNKFRQSSCGVQFFCSPAIPHGFYAQVIHGFVEELVVNDDPEYQWIDKIRTPRASNEARQTLFCKLSGELQRRIGLKALEMGGNAVIGYNQCFDLEGESGIVARGIGTAVSLVKIMDLPPPSPNPESSANEERAQSYLKFLGPAKGFYLNNNSNIISNKFKSQLYTIPSPTASFRSLKVEKQILKPETMPPFLTRHLSDREFDYPVPISPDSMMQHSVSLQTLLKQEDQRGRPGYGISQRFRNLKYTSQNMITRKMTALKAKLGNDDGDSETKRILMRYRRTQSDNGGMAEILVRSMFHATTSLDCIAESPKISSDEEIRDRSFLSLPIPIARSSPVSSCNSNDSTSSADDEDDDDDEDEEEAAGDTIEELDSVSLIVETVRKLSMIQTPILPISKVDYDENKFLFVIGDTEDQQNAGFDEDVEDDANLLYYQDADDDTEITEKSETFLSQFVQTFEQMNKSSIPKSMSGADLQVDGDKKTLNKKFTSLHNFYASESRWNKYSAHGGKETVLGELFRRIDSAHPLSEADLSETYSLGGNSEFDSRMSVDAIMEDDTGQAEAEEMSQGNGVACTDSKEQEQEQDMKVGLRRVKPLKLFVAPHGEPVAIDKTAETRSATSENGNNVKREHKGFLPKKVLKVLHKLDSKLHHKKAKHNNTPPGATSEGAVKSPDHDQKHEHALIDTPSKSSSHLSEDISQHSSGSGNDEHKHGLFHKLKEGKDRLFHAPMDLYHRLDSKIHDIGHSSENKNEIKNEHAQDVLATLHTASPSDKLPEFPLPLSAGNAENIVEHSTHLPGIPHMTGHSHVLDLDDIKMDSVEHHQKTDETVSIDSSGSHAHRHGMFDKLIHGPMDLIHHLDHKIHDIGHHHQSEGGIKNEHGLLNIALGNVLMDSVQDVLATSHTASPSDKPPEFPIPFQTNEPGNIEHYTHAPGVPHMPGHSHVLELDDNKTDSVEHHQKTDETVSIESSGSHAHRHGMLDKLIHGPMDLIHHLDHKIHDIGHHHQAEGGIKNEHGLLNIALGNVLMDSVQDVLATSHTASPSDKPPEFPNPFPVVDTEIAEHSKHVPGILHMPGHSHALVLDDIKTDSMEHHQKTDETVSIDSSGSHAHRHGMLDKLIHGPMDLIHHLDHKIHDLGHHHQAEGGIKNEHGLLNIALGNVLMDSVQDVLATSHTASPSDKPPEFPIPFQTNEPGNIEHSTHVPGVPHMPGHSHVLELDDNKTDSVEHHQKTDETVSIDSSGSHAHRHGMFDKLIHGPMDLIHHLDHKIHDIGHHHQAEGGIKNEHGLLNIALGNVLMDSVQDVLATSHTASPNDKPPEFPIPLPVGDAEIAEHTTHVPGIPHMPGHSHVLELDDIKTDSVEHHQKTDETVSIDFSGSHAHRHGMLDKLIHGPMDLIQHLDHKIHDIGHHHQAGGGIKNKHGLLNIALGNVLMDSVQDVLATSHTASPNDKPPEFPIPLPVGDAEIAKHPTHVPGVPHLPGHSHVLELSEGTDQPSQYDPHHENHHLPGPSMDHPVKQDETTSIDSSGSHAQRHGMLDKLLHGPMDLIHHIGHPHDHHHQSAGGIKNEHGLLNIALGNVLMDSVQEVLATSSPHSKPGTPEFPIEGAGSQKTPHFPGHSYVLQVNDGPTPQSVPQYPNLPPSSTHEPPLSNSLAKPEQIDKQLNTNSHPVRTLNTEIDGGDRDCINTTHACLTTPRNIEMPTPLNPTTTTTVGDGRTENGHHRTESLGVRISHSPAKINAIPCIHRRSSDSDLSITPKGNSLTGSDRSGGYSSGQYMRGAMLRTTRPQENFDIMEYPFLTLSKYPPGFIAHIGGSVSARSVKLLERISNLEEPESRDTWWSEIRMEIRSHARALNCNAVLGYTESTSICDDVCVLSASGTAAVLGFQHTSTGSGSGGSGEAADNVGGLPVLPKNTNTNSTMTTSLDRNDFEKDKDKEKDKPPKVERPEEKFSVPVSKPKVVPSVNGTTNTSPERESTQHLKSACSISHLPYVSNSKPLRSSSIKCCTCGAFKVPDMLIATIEIPDGMLNFGRGCFIQSYVCRPLKDLKGESNAKEISDGLPFLEYELHRFLINKLKVKGMNAIFGLKVRISIGERMLIGIATGTAVFLSSLPPPLLPKLVSDRTTDEKKLTQLQRDLHDTIKRNREIYQLRSIEEVNGESGKLLSESDGSEDETAVLDLAVGNKDCCILEVDDPDDADVLKSVMEPRPPDGFHVVNTEHVPGLEDLEIVKNLQMFTQIWRAKIPPPFDLDKHFHRLLQSVYFKLRRMIPCALCDLQFRVDSPEPDEIQLCVLGMALGLGDPVRNPKKRKIVIPKRIADDDMIFSLEEDQIPEHSVAQTPPTHLLQAQSLKHRQKSPIRNKLLMKQQRHVPYRERHGVDITPLSYVPGGKIEKYLGNLNFFFIRETTSLREEGGLSGFVHSFVTEILAIVRAHVTALGGNAMVAYFITECVLNHNLHKNQGQCLINVGGDVVYVSYFTEDH